MPELPEVETIVRGLNKALPGKRVSGVEVRRKGSFGGEEKELAGKVIERVGRRAKITIISFKGYSKKLIVHLKMTGQLVYIENSKNQKTKNSKRVVGGHPTRDWVSELPSKHTRIIIYFDNGAKLFFNDLRGFGWLKIIENGQWKIDSEKMPPDVTDGKFTMEYFKKIIENGNRQVKLVLLDQAKLGGVGNIYANDALYLARIDPRRKAKGLSRKEINELYLAVREVIDLGIKQGGASIDKYVDAMGVGGKYQEHLLVYKQDGKKCKRDGETIKKIKIGGRGTYYCPKCQK